MIIVVNLDFVTVQNMVKVILKLMFDGYEDAI